MTATDALLRERAKLCDTLEAAGPDAPTLCEGWLTADLAAHLLARETRPDAAVGLVLPGPFARHLENVMAGIAARGYDEMLQRLRSGPPLLHRKAPMARANVNEYWIHHEDVRRARGEVPRELDSETETILWESLRLSALINGRKIKGAGLTLRTPDGRERVVRKGAPMVTVTGPPGELVLFMSGRKEAAAVEIAGSPEAVAIVRAAKFGI